MSGRTFVLVSMPSDFSDKFSGIINNVNSKITGVRLVALNEKTAEQNLKKLEEYTEKYGAYASGIIEADISEEDLRGTVEELIFVEGTGSTDVPCETVVMTDNRLAPAAVANELSVPHVGSNDVGHDHRPVRHDEQIGVVPPGVVENCQRRPGLAVVL